MIGALIMVVLRDGSNQVRWQNFSKAIIVGVVIVVTVSLDLLRKSRMQGRVGWQGCRRGSFWHLISQYAET